MEASVAKLTSDLKFIGFFPNNGTFQSSSCIVHDKYSSLIALHGFSIISDSEL